MSEVRAKAREWVAADADRVLVEEAASAAQLAAQTARTKQEKLGAELAKLMEAENAARGGDDGTAGPPVYSALGVVTVSDTVGVLVYANGQARKVALA